MKVTYSSETSVNFKSTTRRYTPEDKTHHNQRSENLKFYCIKIPTYQISW
jgi:hypothetical protein